VLGIWGTGTTAPSRRKLSATWEVVDNQRLEDMIGSAFLAALVGKPGTAGAVAGSFGVLFVFYDTTLCREVLGYQIWLYENGVPLLRSTSELTDIIDTVYVKPDIKATFLEKNRHFLMLYSVPFEASEVCKHMDCELCNPINMWKTNNAETKGYVILCLRSIVMV
jgi:hypothetical protein